jgi:hypothetical protein
VSLPELISVLPVLIGSGSVGIVWPQLRDSIGSDSVVGMVLEEAFRSQEAHNARVTRGLGRVVSRLRDGGVEPVLIKGLAVARLYPAELVRTAGDIDLVVRDEDCGTAQEVLADVRLSFHADPAARRAFAARGQGGDHGDRPYVEVDLHRFSTWYGARHERFFADVECVPIGETLVRVPRVEDHLRALCLHFLRHGAVRPMRLCDIALLVESGGGIGLRPMGGELSAIRPYGSSGDSADRPYGVPDELDWDRVLNGTAREIEQIAVTLRLAEELLGAGLDDAPAEIRDRALPSWLVPAVLRQWEENPQRTVPHIRELMTTPRDAYTALARRWPDPISATIRTGGRFDDSPGGRLMMRAYLKHLLLFSRARG